MYPEPSGPAAPGEMEDVGLGILLRLECTTVVSDADGKTFILYDYGEVDFSRRVSLIGMLDDVRAGFVDGNLELLHGIVPEISFPGIGLHKTAHLAEVARRARDAQRVD